MRSRKLPRQVGSLGQTSLDDRGGRAQIKALSIFIQRESLPVSPLQLASQVEQNRRCTGRQALLESPQSCSHRNRNCNRNRNRKLILLLLLPQTMINMKNKNYYYPHTTPSPTLPRNDSLVSDPPSPPSTSSLSFFFSAPSSSGSSPPLVYIHSSLILLLCFSIAFPYSFST